MSKHRVMRWIGLLGALLLMAVPGRANYLPGGVAGRVYDHDKNDEPLANLGVCLTTKEGSGNWYATTDANGNYSFANIYKGDYKVSISPGAKYGGGYYGFTKACGVSAGQTTTVDFPLTHLHPDVKADVLQPSGTVGNTAKIVFKIRFNPGAYDVRKIWVWSYDSTAHYSVKIIDAYDMNYFTGMTWEYNEDYSTVNVTIPYDWWMTDWYGGGKYYNGAVTVMAAIEVSNPWGDPIRFGEPPATSEDSGTAGGSSVGPNVQNVCITNVTTDRGEPDYVLIDPDADSQTPLPYIQFEIKDDGKKADANGNPYHYLWYVFLADTRYTKNLTAPNTGGQGAWWSGYLYDSHEGVGVVRCDIPRTGWGEYHYETGTYAQWPAKGSYTFDIMVVEQETGDCYMAKYPYRTVVPPTLPGTTTPGDQVSIEMPNDSTYRVEMSYRIEDDTNSEPADLRIQTIDPQFTQIGDVAAPTELQTLHPRVAAAQFGSAALKEGTYISLLVGEDCHGNGSPTQGYAPAHYREHENKRLLAVNGRKSRPQASIYDYRGTYDSSQISDLLRQRLWLDFNPNVTPQVSVKYLGYAAKAPGAADWFEYVAPRLSADRIFFVASHADAGLIMACNWTPTNDPPPASQYTMITAKTATIGGWVSSASIESDYAGQFSNCKLAIFAGCHTAKTDTMAGWGNLIESAVNSGLASVAVGFREEVVSEGNGGDYAKFLFTALCRGKYQDGTTEPNLKCDSIGDAFAWAASQIAAARPEETNLGYDSYDIVPATGPSQKIVPADSGDEPLKD